MINENSEFYKAIVKAIEIEKNHIPEIIASLKLEMNDTGDNSIQKDIDKKLIRLEELQKHPEPLKYIYIICDDREYRSNIPEILSKYEDLFVLRIRMDNGDYWIGVKTKIERKRGDDLRTSVFAGSEKTNINDELNRLNFSIDSPILIIENWNKMYRENISISDKMTLKYQMEQKMISIMVNQNIPIIITQSENETAKKLREIALYCQNKKEKGVSRNTPKAKSIVDSQNYYYQGLIDVGSKTSKILSERFKSPMKFIEAFKNTEILYNRNDKPKGLKPIDENKPSISGIKGISIKFFQKNYELLNHEEQESK
jgi:ERCC4-type nuclease